MTSSDLAQADEIRAQAGFNQSIEDWRNLLGWEPDGCFVAEAAGRMVGTVTTTTFGRALGWIGMLLVDRDHRRRSIGGRLLEAAVTSLCRVDCVALDATPEGRQLYLNRGFVDRAVLQRWEGNPERPARRPADPADPIEPMRPGDREAVSALDGLACGVDRSRVLDRLVRMSSESWVWRRHDRVVGFALSRPGSARRVLGPMVTLEPDTAPALLAAVLDRLAGRPVVLDVPEGSVVEPVLRQWGLVVSRPLIRMSKTPLPPSRFDLCQAIAGPELG